MITLMPPATKQVANPWFLADKLMSAALPNTLNDGSGIADTTAIPWIGREGTDGMPSYLPTAAAPWTVSGANATWTNADAEGGGIVLGATTYILGSTNSGETAWTWPRGTLTIRIKPVSTAGSKFYFTNGTASASAGGFAISTAGTTAYVKFHDGTAERVLTLGTVAAGTKYTITVEWGDGLNVRAWLNGVASSSTSYPYTMSVGAGLAIRLMCSSATAASQGTFYGFAWFGCRLYDLVGSGGTDTTDPNWQLVKLFTDFYLWSRPEVSTDYTLSTVNPLIGCPRLDPSTTAGIATAQIEAVATGLSVRYTTACEQSDPYLASAVAGASHAIEAGDVGHGLQDDIGAVGRGAGGAWVNGESVAWVAEWSTDDTNFYPFPGGRGFFFPRRTSGDFTLAVFSDTHNATTTGAGAYGYLATNPNTFAFQQMAADMARRRPELIFDLGDTTANYTTGHEAQAHQDAVRNMAHLAGVSSRVYVLGNHEWEAGDKQETYQTVRTVARKSHYPNPINTTYGATMGEAEGLPANPADLEEDTDIYVPGVDWIPQGLTKLEALALFADHIYEFPEAADHEAKMGTNTSPFGNYGAIPWGDTLLIWLDVYRYAGFTGSATSRGLGAVQRAWLEATLLANRTKKHFVVFAHANVGGIADATVDPGEYYGLGSGAQILGHLNESGIDHHNEWLNDELFSRYGCIIVLGHDHVGGIAESGHGCIYVHVPSSNATTNRGRMVSYSATGGAAEIALQGDDNGRVRKFWSLPGYIEMSFSSSGVVIRARQTAVDTHNCLTHATFCFDGKYVGEPTVVAADATTVAVDEVPYAVMAVCLDADGDYYSDFPDDSAIESPAGAIAAAKNLMDHDAQTWGSDDGQGLPVLNRQEPYVAAAVTIASDAAERVMRVHNVPRPVFEYTVRPGRRVGLDIDLGSDD